MLLDALDLIAMAIATPLCFILISLKTMISLHGIT